MAEGTKERSPSPLQELEAGKGAAAEKAVAEQESLIRKRKEQVIATHFKTSAAGKEYLDVKTLTANERDAIDKAFRGLRLPKLNDGDSIDTIIVCAEKLKELQAKAAKHDGK